MRNWYFQNRASNCQVYCFNHWTYIVGSEHFACRICSNEPNCIRCTKTANMTQFQRNSCTELSSLLLNFALYSVYFFLRVFCFILFLLITYILWNASVPVNFLLFSANVTDMNIFRFKQQQKIELFPLYEFHENIHEFYLKLISLFRLCSSELLLPICFYWFLH